MDVNVEAKRIMAVSINKLYATRSQRGGMRLHRSLLLSMVMRSARDIYHSACLAREKEQCATTVPEVPMDTGDVHAEVSPQTDSPLTPSPEPQSTSETTQGLGAGQPGGKRTGQDKENRCPVSPDRHSRKRRGKASVAPDFLPSKRARLEPGEERHAAPSAALRLNFCRAVDSLSSLSLNRAIAAF